MAQPFQPGKSPGWRRQLNAEDWHLQEPRGASGTEEPSPASREAGKLGCCRVLCPHSPSFFGKGCEGGDSPIYSLLQLLDVLRRRVLSDINNN